MKKNLSLRLLCAIACGVASFSISPSSRAATAEVAAGTFTSQLLSGGEWQYDITLSNQSAVNNSNTTIGTFWFSWAPGQQYMEAMPTNVQTPANWTSMVTETTPQGGFGIQYVAMSGDLLAAGQSLSGFTFDSTEAPGQLTSPSTFFQNQIETTSAAYTQGPFSDTTTSGDVFEVTEAAAAPPTPPTPPTAPNPPSNSGGGTSPTPSAVPLPASAWQVLAGLAGVMMILGGKNLKNRTMAI